MRVRTLVPVLAVAAVSGLAAASGLATTMHHMGPVEVGKDPALGNILFTPKGQALYTWNKEKAGRIACTGACAKQWPPLIVTKASAVPKHVTGAMATFGTIKRPDGRLQVTENGHALYRFHADPKGVAKCNNVDGWFAVKAH